MRGEKAEGLAEGKAEGKKELVRNMKAGGLSVYTLFNQRTFPQSKRTWSADPRFIAGRAAALVYKGKNIGVFGEIHPEVLQNWGLTMPCIGAELDLDALV